MAMNAHEPMMQFTTPLLLLREMLIFKWDENNYMHFLQPRLIPFVNKNDIVFAKDDIHTLINIVIVDPMRTWWISLILYNSRICYLWCDSNQRKELSWLTLN